jgi:hypothetical protein
VKGHNLNIMYMTFTQHIVGIQSMFDMWGYHKIQQAPFYMEKSSCYPQIWISSLLQHECLWWYHQRHLTDP